MTTAGPSRGPDTWRPTKYLEPNHPDNEEVLEQAAYQAAVTKLGGDARKSRYKPRRTVDYTGAMLKWRQMAKTRGIISMPTMRPSPSYLINLLPPIAHPTNPSTSICDHFIHTSINKERSPTRVVRWTPDARRTLTGNDKGQFTLWNGQSFNYESITQVHDDSIRAMTFSHDGQALISTDKGGAIKYFTPHLTNVHGFQGHREACHGIAWSPNDDRFVTGGDDGLVKVWNYRAATEEAALAGHGWDVRCVDWHPTKGLIVSGSKDMLVKFWDPRSARELSTLHSHKSTINAAKWGPAGHLVATAGGDGLVRLFDIRTFRELEALKGHTKEVFCIEWHPIHHSIFCSGDGAGAILYWSMHDPDPSKPSTVMEAAHEDAVYSLSFHPLGHLLCSGSKDYTARFWARARPSGGQENDRWHIGEERARDRQYGGEVKKRVWGGDARDDAPGALPGLPGLGAVRAERRDSPQVKSASPEYSAGASLPGLGGLPGLGKPPINTGIPPPPHIAEQSSMPPPRQWGPPTNGYGSNSRAPLPGQNDFLRQGTRAPLPDQSDMMRNAGGWPIQNRVPSGPPLPVSMGPPQQMPLYQPLPPRPPPADRRWEQPAYSNQPNNGGGYGGYNGYQNNDRGYNGYR